MITESIIRVGLQLEDEAGVRKGGRGHMLSVLALKAIRVVGIHIASADELTPNYYYRKANHEIRLPLLMFYAWA
ncbi:uncharacterized protein OCT59_000300 [Rhizophagus irregularis]|uniref:uncharacterized protein n=1 Tax=Rhizophagus irregularis TaxID=588596 RepID=UPI0019E88A18|nr:hypothetical protein OCT59_000300 [Rhizophagus irregularis]GET66554.1 hypothetical protein RIR_jg30980.t1 [Rhizophagus irregularis DAOM 181602=DAOM 197198]CAG8484570.1 22012_t:CDS:2 [Rhizophagus irregularis]